MIACLFSSLYMLFGLLTRHYSCGCNYQLFWCHVFSFYLSKYNNLELVFSLLLAISTISSYVWDWFLSFLQSPHLEDLQDVLLKQMVKFLYPFFLRNIYCIPRNHFLSKKVCGIYNNSNNIHYINTFKLKMILILHSHITFFNNKVIN